MYLPTSKSFIALAFETYPDILFHNIINCNKQDASITVTHWRPRILETVGNDVHVGNISDHMLMEASNNLRKSQDLSQETTLLKMKEISERGTINILAPSATRSKRSRSFSAPYSQDIWAGRRGSIDLSNDESLVKILPPNGEVLTAKIKNSALTNLKAQSHAVTLVEQDGEDEFRSEYLNGLIRKLPLNPGALKYTFNVSYQSSLSIHISITFDKSCSSLGESLSSSLCIDLNSCGTSYSVLILEVSN